MAAVPRLAFALKEWPKTTLALAFASVSALTFETATWAFNRIAWPLNLGHGLDNPPSTMWSGLGLPPYAGLALVFAAAFAAFTLAAGNASLERRELSRKPLSPHVG